MINFRGIKSGPVAFLGFLSLKVYLTIETTTQDEVYFQKQAKIKNIVTFSISLSLGAFTVNLEQSKNSKFI